MTHKATRKRVTRTRGVENLIERVTRNKEHPVVGEKYRAMFSLLYNDDLRPFLLNPACCSSQIRLPCELTDLFVIDEAFKT